MLDPAHIERRLAATFTVVLLAVAITVQVGINGDVLVAPAGRAATELIAYGFLAVLGCACALALRARGRIRAAVRWPGVAALLGCSVALSVAGDGALPPQHWSIGLIGWYGLVLLYDLAIGWMVAFLVWHAAVTGLPVLLAGSAAASAEMAVALVSVAGFQIGVALSARLARSIADGAFRTARAQERQRIRDEEAAAAARNHERRYAQLRPATIPLLAGLADGSLDPRAEDVRRRCAVEAARMRRLLCAGHGAAVSDRLAHELGAIIDVAERHGASVHLSVRGTPVDVPEDVRRDLLAPISEALVTARSPARVTVLHAPDRVRVSARCAAPRLPITPPERGEVSLVESVADGQVWLETSWRSR